MQSSLPGYQELPDTPEKTAMDAENMALNGFKTCNPSGNFRIIGVVLYGEVEEFVARYGESLFAQQEYRDRLIAASTPWLSSLIANMEAKPCSQYDPKLPPSWNPGPQDGSFTAKVFENACMYVMKGRAPQDAECGKTRDGKKRNIHTAEIGIMDPDQEFLKRTLPAALKRPQLKITTASMAVKISRRWNTSPPF